MIIMLSPNQAEELKIVNKDHVKAIQQIITIEEKEDLVFPQGNPEPTYKPIPKTVTETQAWSYIRRKEASSTTSLNPVTYACGLPQANDCDKLLDAYGIYHKFPVEKEYYTIKEAKALVAQVTEEEQLEWMETYVMDRYKSFVNAMNFHKRNGWY